jgi:hypothetical protein
MTPESLQMGFLTFAKTVCGTVFPRLLSRGSRENRGKLASRDISPYVCHMVSRLLNRF